MLDAARLARVSWKGERARRIVVPDLFSVLVELEGDVAHSGACDKEEGKKNKNEKWLFISADSEGWRHHRVGRRGGARCRWQRSRLRSVCLPAVLFHRRQSGPTGAAHPNVSVPLEVSKVSPTPSISHIHRRRGHVANALRNFMAVAVLISIQHPPPQPPRGFGVFCARVSCGG